MGPKRHALQVYHVSIVEDLTKYDDSIKNIIFTQFSFNFLPK